MRYDEPLAVISVTVYNRVDKLRSCVESLLKNQLAARSHLMIFSDAAKAGDEKLVHDVRRFVATIEGFKSVTLVANKLNNPQLNALKARVRPFTISNKIIRLEDDIIVSRNFLNFMNCALSLYESKQNVLAVSGYSVLDGDVEEVFLSKEWSAWGWGSWANRPLTKILLSDEYFDAIRARCSAQQIDKMKRLNWKLPFILNLIQKKKSNAGDYKHAAWLWLNDQYVVKPTKTLTSNIGFDGSGGAGTNTKQYDVLLDQNYMPRLPEKPLVREDLDAKMSYVLYSSKSYLKLRFYAYFLTRLIFPKILLSKALLLRKRIFRKS